MAPIEMTPEEFKALEEATTPRAAPLIIKSKLLGPPHRLDDTSIHDIEFVDCDFLGQFMFNVSLTNVKFTRCAIVGVRWEDGKWNNVSFIECAAEGRANNIVPGGGDGPNLFQGCHFIGDTPPPGGDFDSLEYQGAVGSAGKTKFEKCTFERMKIWVLGTASFTDCRFASAGMQSPRSRVPIDELRIERCDGTYSLDLSTPGMNSLTLSDCSFNELLVNNCASKSVRLDRVRANVDLSGLDADSLVALNCEFRSSVNTFDKTYDGGLNTIHSRFGRLNLSNCQFTGENVAWTSKGVPPIRDSKGQLVPRFTSDNKPLRYLNEWADAVILKTPIANADWSYSHIGTLTLSDTSFVDSKVTHCEIDQLGLNTVTLGGALDFSDTRVNSIRSQGVEKKNLNVIRDKLTKLDLATADAFDRPAPGRRSAA